MLCSTSLEELPALFRMLMGALQTLDSSRAPVVEKQFADWSCVLWITHCLSEDISITVLCFLVFN
jgi:hypothetical protein